jgi:hypothetical protein
MFLIFSASLGDKLLVEILFGQIFFSRLEFDGDMPMYYKHEIITHYLVCKCMQNRMRECFIFTGNDVLFLQSTQFCLLLVCV